MVYKIPPGGGKPYPASGLGHFQSFFILFFFVPPTLNMIFFP